MNYLQMLGFSSLIALSSFQAVGQDLDEDELLLSYGDEELISIATGKIQPLFKAPAVATVITAAQIASMKALNLDQVLESVPGLHVSISSYRGSPIYSIRGIHTDKNPQILLLVNGTPLTQFVLGDRGVNSSLPINHIERVEIIRGPGSAIYGADAVSGVINVITKGASRIDGVEIGSQLGSFATKDIWASYALKVNDWNVFIGVEALETNGDATRIINFDAQSLLDTMPMMTTPASRAPGPLSTAHKRLDIRFELTNQSWTIRGWNWRQENGVGPGLASALDPDGQSKVNNYLFDVTHKGSSNSKKWEYETRLAYMDINTKSTQTLLPAGTILPIGPDGNINATNPNSALINFSEGLIGNPEIYESHWRLDYISYFSGWDKHHIRLATGLSYATIDAKESKNFGPGVLENAQSLPGIPFPIVDGRLTDVSNTDFIYIRSENRTVKFFSIQDEWSITSDWALTAGVRYDHYSDFGSTVNPRIALVWDTMRNMTTKLLYGKAFRAPAMAELYAINNPVVLGNPDLDPEAIDSYELAFDYRPRFDIRTGLNIFYYQLDDLIVFVQDQGLSSRTAQNVGTQTGRGFEIEFDLSLQENLLLSGQYSYQHAKDKRNNVDSGNAPKQKIYLDLRWKFMPNWFMNTQFYWIANRQREHLDTRQEISDYGITNVSIGCNCLLPQLNVSFAIKNLFDKKAFEPSPAEVASFIPGDYPIEQRSAFLQAHYRF